MNMNALTELINKSLQIIERNVNEISLPNIEKDMLLANIRHLYDLALEIPVQSSNNRTSINIEESELTDPTKIETTPNIVAEKDEKVLMPPDIIIPEPVPFVIEMPTAVTTRTEELNIPEPIEPEVIEKDATIEPKTAELTIISSEIIVNEKSKPSFDELVDKVKEQFSNSPQPQQMQSVTEDDEDDDTPVFFSDFKFDKLFDTEYARELSDKLSASKIEDIGKAMGLNEKIFTVNELFGGEHTAFEKAINDIHACSNFNEAKIYISEQLAPKYQWMEGGKFKKAKEFIKLVKRKFS